MIGRTREFIRNIKYLSAFFILLHIAGFIFSLEAVMSTRTPQGAIAWVISLNTFPLGALPAYWVFGRSKFNGYVIARREDNSELSNVAAEIVEDKALFRPEQVDRYPSFLAAELLAQIPALKGNDTELLIDGRATFDSIFSGIKEAKDYILVQFFIIKNDTLGQELKDRLIAKAKEGVKVYFLYDEIGSHALPESYLAEMRKAGIEAINFHSRKGPNNRFQINFRNHRKIVVVDGETCWVGGHNVGDQYLGEGERFSHWRDTHLKISGPAVVSVQLSFLEDYHWATDSIPRLDWQRALQKKGDKSILVIPSGPADELETAGLMFTHAINSARQRIWIASPYFVPDHAIVAALELAALRGVDVRILIPDEPDHLIVYLAAFSYIEKFNAFNNIRFYRYTKGFMHQKAMVIDETVAVIGTANFDNRSFRLNFELTALVANMDFNAEVAEMFLEDFSHSRIMVPGETDSKPFWFHLGVRLARLASPLL